MPPTVFLQHLTGTMDSSSNTIFYLRTAAQPVKLSLAMSSQVSESSPESLCFLSEAKKEKRKKDLSFFPVYGSGCQPTFKAPHARKMKQQTCNKMAVLRWLFIKLLIDSKSFLMTSSNSVCSLPSYSLQIKKGAKNVNSPTQTKQKQGFLAVVTRYMRMSPKR